MKPMLMVLGILLAFLVAGWTRGQEDGGTIVGKLKSRMDTPDGRNTNFEVLAPGEEKARKYHVVFDQKLKKPIPKVLEAVRAARIGDTVELEWQKTGHGPAVRSFKVVSPGKKEKGA